MISAKAFGGVTGPTKYLLAIILVLFSFSGTARAQVTASIVGTTRDTSGAVVPGASITVKDVETGVTRTAETDASGSYSVPSLPIGRYEVDAEKSGFKKEVRQGITLVVGQEAVVNLTLEIGNVEQQVTVTAEAPLINTTVESTSGLVSEKEVRNLPLNGRSFDQLLTLNTGAINETSNRTAGGNMFSVSGRRPEENRFLMNGVDYIGGSNGDNTVVPNGANGEMLGLDAIREFNVVQNTYGAEYGKRAGGQISVVTNSGTNQIHGSAFEFLRNSVFDARNFFDHPIGERIPPFKRNQFGGTLGGPIKKDKLFLFLAGEGFRQRLGLSDLAIVPDNFARIGELPNAAGVETPVKGLVPGMLPFVDDFWPAPNGPELTQGAAELFASPLQKVNDNYGLARFDYTISAKDTFSANYMIQRGENYTPDADYLFVNFLPIHSQLLSLQETHIFSPALLNTATVGFARAYVQSAGTFPITSIPSSLLFVTGSVPGTITIGGNITGQGGSFSSGGGGPAVINDRNFFTWADDLHYVSGKHSWSAGVWIQRIQSNTDGGNTQQTAAFSTLQNMLTDVPSSFAVIPTEVMLGFRSTEAAWYVQDEIKLKPNFTMRFGLRDEMTSGWNAANGRCPNYFFDNNGVLDTNPTLTPSCLIQNNSLALLQPRIGLAWDPRGNGKWSVRAGFGIYNDLQDNPNQALGSNPPYNGKLSETGPMLSYIPIPGGTEPPPSCSATQGPPCSTFTPGQLDPNMHTPTIQQWSLTVERQLTNNLMLQAGYVGSQSYHLQIEQDPNSIEPQVCQKAAGCVSGGDLTTTGLAPQGTLYVPVGNIPNPYVPADNERTLIGTSNYNALGVSLLKRASNGLSFKINYTYAKALDIDTGLDSASGTNESSDILDPFNLKLSKGPTGFDIEHQFNANFSYDLPFGHGQRWGNGVSGALNQVIGGWQWNGILTLETGFPFTPLAGSNRSGNGDTRNPDVPNLNPAFTGPVITGNPNQWYNPAAFTLPAPGTFGDAGRNQFWGPGLADLDTSLFKNFRMSERFNLQFRAEFFNIINHVNFDTPTLAAFSGTSVSPTAGLITGTATSSRQIQFALKLMF